MQYLLSPRSSTDDDDFVTLHCGSNSVLIHCSAFTHHTSIDSAYLGPPTQAPDDIPYYDYDKTNYPSQIQGIAQNGGSNVDGIMANVACCKFEIYDLKWITRYDSPSYPYSTVQCPIGCFMAGWSVWGPWSLTYVTNYIIGWESYTKLILYMILTQ